MDSQTVPPETVMLPPPPVSQRHPADLQPDQGEEDEPNQGHVSTPTKCQSISATDLQSCDRKPPLPNLPLSETILPPEVTPFIPNAPEPPRSPSASSVLSDLDPNDFVIDHDYDGLEGQRVLRLKPTVGQWHDFPALLGFARRKGAEDDGCFKIILPAQLQEPLPGKDYHHKVPANAYRPSQIKKNSFWRVNTVPSEGVFASSLPGPDYTSTALEALNDLKKMFHKSNRKQIRNVRYRVDVPAWTPDQRRAAGVPERSPIHPLKGDKLDHTKAIIPGIHTPYVYESGPHFGASFQIHAEDFRLVSLNHLYKGRKIWIVVPSTAVDIAEEALGRKHRCSQFMRHRAEFFFPNKLEKLGIPFRIVDQRPGETIVILPDAYHEGFSTGYTIAEAKNYADPSWTTETYQPCEESCKLVTAIPAELMRPLKEGEERLDLCAAYTPLQSTAVTPSEEVKTEDSIATGSAKRNLEDDDHSEQDPKRIKESVEGTGAN